MNSYPASESRQPALEPYDEVMARFTYAILLDVLLMTTAEQWEHRADQLEAARPHRRDFTGNATPAQITAQWLRLTDAAAACRAKAKLLRDSRTDHEDLASRLVSGDAA